MWFLSRASSNCREKLTRSSHLFVQVFCPERLWIIEFNFGLKKTKFLQSWQSVGLYLLIGMLIMNLYYIHTEKYSSNCCVVNFDTQISSSQSEE